MYEIENINQRKIRSTKKLDTAETFSKSFKKVLDFPENLMYHKYSTKEAEGKSMTEQEARKHFGLRQNDRISVSGLQETMRSAKRVLQRSQSRTDRLEAERDIRACEALMASPAFIVDFSFVFID